MKTYALPVYTFASLRSLLASLCGVAFICIVPALAHLTGIPVYFIEPMRLMLVIAMLFSHRGNAFILAIMLPLLSFLVSGHPEPLKMSVIMAELSLNVWLFYLLFSRTAKPFMSMLVSILASKLFCYSAYLFVFSWAFVKAEAEPVFVTIQLIVTMLLSASANFVLRMQRK